MPAGDQIAYDGETVTVAFTETAQGASGATVALTLDNVTATFWDDEGDPDDQPSPDGASGSVDGQTAYYPFTATTGDYRWELAYDVAATGFLGGQHRIRRGRLLVWPALGASLLDPYINLTQGVMQEADFGVDPARLSLRDYRDVVRGAVREYEKDRPREIVFEFTTADSTYEYDLPDGEGAEPVAPWVNRFSRFLDPAFTYPPDDTRLNPLYPPPQDQIDEVRGVWRFLNVYPPIPGTIRLNYTTRHTLTHTADTLPAVDQEAVCRYAAGLALQRLATVAAGTNETQTEAQIVSYGTQFERYMKQAALLKAEGKALWQPQQDAAEKRQGAYTVGLVPPAGQRAERQWYQRSDYGD
jgi:hypothetical protein